jgi:hypothetical protein
MLLAANLIDEVQMRVALAEQKRTGKKFGSTLVDLQFIDENVLAAFLSKQVDIPCISLLHIDIPKKVLRRIPAAVARYCRAIPIRIEEGRLEVALVDPTDLDGIERLETSAQMTVVPLIAPQSSIEKMIDHFYPDETVGDDTLTAAQQARVVDPMFRDLIEELDAGDIDYRLGRIEESLKEMWVLLEKILRKVEHENEKSGSFR